MLCGSHLLPLWEAKAFTNPGNPSSLQNTWPPNQAAPPHPMLRGDLGPLPAMTHLGAERTRGPAHNPDPQAACCGGCPTSPPSSPTLGLHLQPWSCTWGHQVLWCPPVDICFNSTSQDFLLAQAQQGPGAPWALANMLAGLPSSWCLKYEGVLFQVGYCALRSFQSPEANGPQATAFQHPACKTQHVERWD